MNLPLQQPNPSSKHPLELSCYICKLICEEPVQIICCNEIFCKIHIEEEIKKNYICPNCNHAVSEKDYIQNKLIKKLMKWYHQLKDINNNIDKDKENELIVINSKDNKGKVFDNEFEFGNGFEEEDFLRIFEVAKQNEDVAKKLGLTLLIKEGKEKAVKAKINEKDEKRKKERSRSYRSKKSYYSSDESSYYKNYRNKEKGGYKIKDKYDMYDKYK